MKGGRFDSENNVSSEIKLFDKSFNKNYLTGIIQKIKNNPETQNEMELTVEKHSNYSYLAEPAKKNRVKGKNPRSFL